MLFGIIGWVIIGLIVGFVASKLVNLRGDDPRLSIGVAAVGAVVGGAVYTFISGTGVAAWNPWSMVFAGIGGILAATVWHAVRSRYISHERYVPRKSY